MAVQVVMLIFSLLAHLFVFAAASFNGPLTNGSVSLVSRNIQSIHRTAAGAHLMRASVGWGILDVLPNAFMSIIYKDTFRVNVYQQQNVDILQPLKVQYYYSPALLLDPSSAVCSLNNFNKRFEVTISVIMWDNEFETFVLNAISAKVGVVVPRSSLRVLPVEAIRVDSNEQSLDYEILNQWTSYASQPSVFQFRLRFLQNDTCTEIAQKIKEEPEHFTSDLVVYYSLQTQKSSKRCVQVKAEHVPVPKSCLRTVVKARLHQHDSSTAVEGAVRPPLEL